ncbi:MULTISPECIES: DUF4129 domain-containing protein [unclassified Pseudomonas]|uniref:DUF4129 domain-containing protein n=1 Tax=unclassified Pseudomonas TaxID=196821 RepID=UPI000BD2844F|nr:MULTISPECIES: DUF4129 domain-containing protein [unclassified Pseudomonas]PVZ11197.1 uncharacterized protein DUF4129 [Pseudomonas sp. URIL14HWK12:I12]PVZ22195.1 uncharacterized protein DUF4129 [Pseudomonas sp. URIL14HWK12:I10]PVZ31681.1 uncharacterized protein DUF4129 [Pseudomonas sp. URIL14HWK12:I11]SNZ16790.1 protein of unknown function [Pseudomonas sp. URIL14HWK12:I9]
MNLTDASVSIRPRSRWEAIDLGLRLAGHHRRLLVVSWLWLTIPTLLLLTALSWRSPTVAVVVFWWLKPAFDELPLHILAQGLFTQPPTVRQALRAWPRLLGRHTLANLTWRRFNPLRSFDLPVAQLEGLRGAAYRDRLALLHRQQGRAASWLTLVGMHVEAVLLMGISTVLLLMIPLSDNSDWEWFDTLRGIASQEANWASHLSNLLYGLVVAFWEPMYVACGFTLYLNRRTWLEAWDLELILRSLGRRLTPALALVLWLAAPWASPPAQATQPEPARLTHQRLDSGQSRQAIDAILHQPPFSNPRTETRWHWRGEKAAHDKPEPKAETAPRDKSDAAYLQVVAQMLQALLWLALVAAIGWLAWHYRRLLHGVGQRITRRRPRAPAGPQQLFGLDLAPESLPDDLASHAERLWQQDARQALGLLYRGLLSRLLNDYHVPLHAADTEGQVLRRVEQLQLSGLEDFSQKLTRHWQALAYGHQSPPPQVGAELCQGWRRLFSEGEA